MKIFAKRKRTTVPAGGSPVPSTPQIRNSFASDPLVEELLKKDPKEWNSKERRMIKRYQERKVESEQDAAVPPHQDGVVEEENIADQAEQINQDEIGSSDNDENANDHDSNGTSDSEDKQINGDDDLVPTSTELQEYPFEATITSDEASKEKIVKEVNENDGGEIDPSHEVYKILEQLNSKTKRTLTRKLERCGLTVLDEVTKEAKKALAGSTETSTVDSKKRAADDKNNSGDMEGKPTKKKSKTEVDLSSLSAEERLRREEQRRKQQEALERRARGEDKTPGYKHPLNSERRRANKRKPKWTSGSGAGSKGVKNEHHHSGYLHRKHT
jgi:hypothetical protein